MFRINHAILHVFDFVSCVNVFSEEELDLTSKNAKNYVVKHARKALGCIENKHGTFSDDSMFAGELRSYFRGERDFVDLSVQIAQFMATFWWPISRRTPLGLPPTPPRKSWRRPTKLKASVISASFCWKAARRTCMRWGPASRAARAST